MEVELSQILNRGYARVLLHHIFSESHPDMVGKIEDFTAEWEKKDVPSLIYSSNFASPNHQSAIRMVLGLLNSEKDLAVADFDLEDAEEFARHAKLPVETAQKIFSDIRKYQNERRELLRISRVEEKEKLIGQNPRWLEILNLALKIARSNAPVLITGETGTGKERLALYIHKHSLRFKKPFKTISCGALPETLIPSEFFGYENGAFTGALAGGKKGRLETASGGTLLLDDVDLLSLNAQTALLRFIETGAIQKVGGVEDKTIDARLICTTNQDLRKLLQEAKFRPDLYYRLSIYRLDIPPLRLRKDDIPLFVHHFLKIIDLGDIPPGRITISEEAITKLLDYDWPGNLRELQSVLSKAAIICKNYHILPRDIVFVEGFAAEPIKISIPPEKISVEEQKMKHIHFNQLERTLFHSFLLESKNRPITNRIWVQKFQVSPATARRRLSALVKAGILKREGKNRGSKYFLAKKD